MWGVADYEFHVKETHSDLKDNGEFSAHNKDTSPSPPAIYRTEPVSCAGPDLNSQSQPGQHHHKAG